MTETVRKLAEILLVEDNEGDIELTKEAFEEAMFSNTLHVARDGDEALDFVYKRNAHAQATTPDIILLDLNLPGTDGREVLETLKKDAKLRHIPVVILTSSSADRDVIESYNLHANCYLVKPVTSEKFIGLVRNFGHFWIDLVCLHPGGKSDK